MRFLTPGFLFLLMTSCSNEPNAILVTVSNLPPRADKLSVDATLGGTMAMKPIDITNPVGQFGVKFDAGASGHLELDVLALDSDDCEQASASTTYELPIDFTSTALSLNGQSPRKCARGTLNPCAAGSVCTGPKPNSENVESLFALSPTDIWAVGHNASILHFDGTNWTSYDWGPTPPTQDLYGIWGSAADDIWAVGTFGLIVHYDGSKWMSRTSTTNQNLRGIWGVGPTAIWTVGDSPNAGVTQGTFLHYDGISWQSVNTAGVDNLKGVWADNSSGSNLIYACGDNGSLVRFDGSKTPAWSAIQSNTVVGLNGIWGTRSPTMGSFGNTLFAVGSGGTVVRIRYGIDPGWTVLSNTGTSLALYGVRGDDDKQLVYAYGQNGTLVTASPPYDKFTAASNGPAQTLFGATFSTGNLVWLGGAAGYLGFVDLNP